MTGNDFIFSNQPRYRISRHLVFWISWFIFSFLTIHIPFHILINWQPVLNWANVEKLGGLDMVLLKAAARQLIPLTCNIIFTYAIIYYFLPRYLHHPEKWPVTTAILLLIILAFLFAQYGSTWATTELTTRHRLRSGLDAVESSAPVLVRRAIFYLVSQTGIVVGLAVCIKLFKHWWLKLREREQVTREKLSAELNLLKAQVHPHFLFNSLNNIYSMTLENSPMAPGMIRKFSDLLQYMTVECSQDFVPLEKELKLVADYVSLERIRYGDRIRIQQGLGGELAREPLPGKRWLIAPFILLPFVENSFKHGTSKMLDHPYVTLDISVYEDRLYFKLNNSKVPGLEDMPSRNGKYGVGLTNVKKRLNLLYQNRYELQISDTPEIFSVWLVLALTPITAAWEVFPDHKNVPVYEPA